MLTHPALPVVNPSSGAHLRDVPCDSADELGLKLDHSREAQGRWGKKSVEVRVRELSGALGYFRRRKESVARDIAREMGKPLSQALGEVETLLARCEHMLSIAPAALAPEALAAPSGFEFRIEHAPIGLVLDIAAWNYPLIVPASVVIPALAAGNAVILKHSPKCPAAGEHFEQALALLSEPEIFQHVVVPDSEAGALVADPRIDHVCFTGSTSVGREVWRTAAANGIQLVVVSCGRSPAAKQG
jgi:acyl-CoA reductase-like NAD-dependent aldehyde dehydrogenase